MIESDIQIQLQQFDGPLALLLHLVQKQEMSISELDISEITQQYLHYLQHMRELNFDIAGEYLYMASSLLYIKSQYCVLDEQEQKIDDELENNAIDITSRSDLIKKLEQLEHFQRLSQKLSALPQKNKDIFVKPKVDKKAIINSILTPIDIEQLTNTMVQFLRKQNRKFTVIQKDKRSIKRKLVDLKRLLTVGKTCQFEELMQEEERDISEIVITFISLLELARLKKVLIFQNTENANLYLEVIESLENFDVDEADGFGEEQTEASKEKEESPVVTA